MTIGLGNPPVAATPEQLAQVLIDLGIIFASQAEAEAGTNATKYMSPQRVAQAIAAIAGQFDVATQAEAEAGTNNTKGMTPLRVKQAIDALASSSITFSTNISASGYMKTAAGDPCDFLGIFCVSNSGGTAKVTVYDGASNAGTPKLGSAPAASGGVVMTPGQSLNFGVATSCPNGLYIEISGTATYTVIYK